MLESERSSNKTLKVAVVIVGLLFVAGGTLPFISPYFSEKMELIDQMLTEIGAENKLTETASEDGNNTQNNEQSDTISESESRNAILVQQREEEAALLAENSLANNLVKHEEKSIEVDSSLPDLQDSDPFVLDEMQDAFVSSNPASFLTDVDVVRNIVVFIDNFSRGELVSKFSPVVKPDGQFSVSKQNGITYISQESYQRYNDYAASIEAIDAGMFIDVYALFSPLIDEAYQEIGYPANRFNATFNKAIEHVLATPVIHYKLEVTAPSAMYLYTDEHFELLPATQKLMLRMGPKNLQTIKNKLIEIQIELQRL